MKGKSILTAIIFIKISELNFAKTYKSFDVAYEWNHINFTWESLPRHSRALERGKFKYIPENVVPAGIKIYQDRIFVALSKLREGVPVSLAYFWKNDTTKTNIPLIPYPSWDDNNDENCRNFQSIQAMEIDTVGLMWVLDGERMKGHNDCSCKLYLLDLKNSGKKNHIYTFPNNQCRKVGGFLNDIVIDETDGGYAYITEFSLTDPGLIVYSREKNKSWKLRDSTMFLSDDAPKFKIDGNEVPQIGNIDGIALSPKKSDSNERILFYTPLTGYNLYRISTKILKNEKLCSSDTWRGEIHYVGKKQGATDGMIIDENGDLFYTLISLNAIGKWNINTVFNTSEIIYQNNKSMIWPDTFSFDNKNRDLYVISNHISSYLGDDVHLDPLEIKFIIWKYYTGTKSYICTGPKAKCSCLCVEKKAWYCY